MSNNLDRFGESLRKDAKETEQNTRRISANLPLIERKLDVISGDTPYVMEFPLAGGSHSVMLNIRLKPDNCCDCIPGADPASRFASSGADYIWDTVLTKIPHSSGFPDLAYYPTHSWVSGVDYPVHYPNPMNQTGIITNIWFAWTNYPFFWPFVDNPYGYGNFTPVVADTGGIGVPVNGIYTVIFKNRVRGWATPTSSLIIAIKRLKKDTDPAIATNWQTISRKIYSVERGNLDESILGIYGSPVAVYAYCFPLNQGDIVGGWIKATDIDGFSPSEGGEHEANKTEIDLIGLGWGAITGILRDQNGQPVIGATISYTGNTAQQANSGTTYTNDEGRWTFYELAPDITYMFTATKTGYNPATQQGTSIFNTLVTVDIVIVHI